MREQFLGNTIRLPKQVTVGALATVAILLASSTTTEQHATEPTKTMQQDTVACSFDAGVASNNAACKPTDSLSLLSGQLPIFPTAK